MDSLSIFCYIIGIVYIIYYLGRSRRTKTIMNRFFNSDVNPINMQKLLNMDSSVHIQIIEGNGSEKALEEFRQGGRYKLTHQKNYNKVKEW